MTLIHKTKPDNGARSRVALLLIHVAAVLDAGIYCASFTLLSGDFYSRMLCSEAFARLSGEEN